MPKEFKDAEEFEKELDRVTQDKVVKLKIKGTNIIQALTEQLTKDILTKRW